MNLLARSVLFRWLWNMAMYRLKRPQDFRPYVYTIFVTYRCNFRCTYCDNGEEEKYPDLKMTELDTEAMKNLIRMIREESEVIGFGGGEPLLRSDLEELMDYARHIGFKRIVMNTNSWQIMKRITLLDYVDDLMVSLDSMNPDYLDRLYGIRPGSGVQILDNLCTLAHLQKMKKFRLIINSVLMPENLPDMYDVIRFCIEHDVQFSPSPRLNGPYPDPELSNHAGYQQLIDAMIDLKKKGMKILETEDYLRMIRDFKYFHCYPQLYLRINPSGDLQYPCMILNDQKIHLPDYPSLKEALKQIEATLDVRKLSCDNRCHISCYIEPSLSVQRPSGILREALQIIYERWIRFAVAYHKEQLLVWLNELKMKNLMYSPNQPDSAGNSAKHKVFNPEFV